MLKQEMREHLEQCILPFWNKMIDRENGGFFGSMDYDRTIPPQGEKGVLLNSRILWFYSNVYFTLQDPKAREYAAHAYQFLKNHCLDPEYGGVYWIVSCQGQPVNTEKHLYNQAFAIFALSSYYMACGDREAIRLAGGLFDLIESKFRNSIAYGEAFSRDLTPIENTLLSHHGVLAVHTTNAAMHLLEAYTEFYRATGRARVKSAILRLLDLFYCRIYNPEKKQLEVFFDRQYNSMTSLHSIGQDIQTAWLLDRACSLLPNSDLVRATKEYSLELVEGVFQSGFADGVLALEHPGQKAPGRRSWWIQAEGVVGFYNAWQRTGNPVYQEVFLSLWDFIQKYLVDHRPGGEWLWAVNGHGRPDTTRPLVSTWKGPYHNGRMCIEIMRRYLNVPDD